MNSKDGSQNLTRFLFGSLRVDDFLDIDDITLPFKVQAALSGGQTINASYQFEVVASLRGVQWQITRREARENSAIFRTYDNLFPGKPGTLRTPDRGASPRLMHQLADTGKRAADVQCCWVVSARRTHIDAEGPRCHRSAGVTAEAAASDAAAALVFCCSSGLEGEPEHLSGKHTDHVH